MTPIGLGDPDARLAIYIANRPPLEAYQNLNYCKAIEPFEIKTIAEMTGNHWRKIFNCYAKLAFKLDTENCATWQELREKFLLQKNSGYGLFFLPPDLNDLRQIKIIAGKQYWSQLALKVDMKWIDNDFAVSLKEQLIVSPYFDYRQLSNLKIERLVELIQQVKMGTSND